VASALVKDLVDLALIASTSQVNADRLKGFGGTLSSIIANDNVLDCGFRLKPISRSRDPTRTQRDAIGHSASATMMWAGSSSSRAHAGGQSEPTRACASASLACQSPGLNPHMWASSRS